MYIRWVVRKHKNSATANVVFHDAYLVESYRDPANKPRQRTICYLGNIRQIDDDFPAIERELFLLRAERILAGVPDVGANDHAAVIALLRQKVPELTAGEVLLAFRNNMRWYQRWWRAHGGAPSLETMLQLIGAADEGMGAV
jgi:hypothetical protein